MEKRIDRLGVLCEPTSCAADYGFLPPPTQRMYQGGDSFEGLETIMTEAQATAAAAKPAKKETQVETVTMTDGRKVDFPGKRKMLKESFVAPDGQLAVRFDFRNGATRTYTLHSSLISKFATHGAEQKYGDETAGLDDVDDMVMATDKLHTRLNPSDGTEPAWTMEREGSGMAGTSVLAQALAKVQNVDIEKVKAFLSKKTQAEKIALRNNPKVKPVVEEIEAAKAAKNNKVDTDALLGELGGLDAGAGAPDGGAGAPA